MKTQLLKSTMDNEWIMYESEQVHLQMDKYFQAVELMNYDHLRAEKLLLEVIEVCKNEHIDAILHLGFLYKMMGLTIEGNALLYKAHYLGLEAIPTTFDSQKDKIRWGVIENRPLLRTFHSIGLELMEEGYYEKAASKFNFMLAVNENDNQGVRYLLLDCYFRLKKTNHVAALLKEHDDEYSIEFLYAKVLLNLQTNNIKAAEISLDEAQKGFPYGAKEIVKKKHPKPRKENSVGFGVLSGGKQEAYNFWQRNKQVWVETENAIEFVRENIKPIKKTKK